MDRASLSVLLLLAACSSQPTVFVELRTDFLPDVEIRAVTTEVWGGAREGEPLARAERSVSAADDFTEFVRIAELPVSLGSHRVRVALLGASGVLLADRLVDIEVQASHVVSVSVTRSCAAVRCDVGLTCRGGACVDPSCVTGAEATCPPPACAEDGECPTGAACARPRCTDAECYLVARTDGCPSGQLCDPVRGCQVIGADAGCAATGPEVCNGVDDDCDVQIDEGFELATDPMRCGSCDTVCTAAHGAPRCSGGRCSASCDAGWADCDADPTTCETDVSRASDCGACDVRCAGSTPTCAPDGSGGHRCASGCAGGATLCGGSCVDLDDDEEHCGGCSNACDAGEICSAGSCRCGGDVCDISDACCGGACASTSSDTSHCGGCGNACGAGETCSGGSCRCGGGAACGSGQTCCAGVCVGTSSDASNCGGCGVACDAGETCVSGSCRCGGASSCGFSESCCAGTCVDTRFSQTNCGACGVACGPSEECFASRCNCGIGPAGEPGGGPVCPSTRPCCTVGGCDGCVMPSICGTC